MNDKTIQLKIFRCDPQEDRAPVYKTYEVPWEDGLLLLTAVKYIRDNMDDTLSFRDYCCGCSWCMSCMMTVDGKSVQSCSRPLKPGEKLLVEPLKGFPVIKDLVVDFGTAVRTSNGIFKKMEGTIINRKE
jgi:succinate dehydrogenase/fumarate reductase-like Fe-S protein